MRHDPFCVHVSSETKRRLKVCVFVVSWGFFLGGKGLVVVVVIK